MGKHWTNESDRDFMFAVAMDFLAELEAVMDEREMSRKELADKLSVTEGRVSQILNNPGNLTLGVMVKWARALNLKVALVAYDDGDYENENGPVFPGIFRSCWEHLNKPTDGWELQNVLMPSEQAEPFELEETLTPSESDGFDTPGEFSSLIMTGESWNDGREPEKNNHGEGVKKSWDSFNDLDSPLSKGIAA